MTEEKKTARVANPHDNGLNPQVIKNEVSYGSSIGITRFEHTRARVENDPCRITVSTGNRIFGKGGGNIRIFPENFFRIIVE
jgi:hypothetical protein